MSILPTARRDHASGTLSPRVSADNPGPETDQALSGAKAHGIGDAGFGIGVDRPGDDRNVVAGLAAGLCAAGAKPVFGSNDDNYPAAEDDAYGASASFVSGSATFTAFASNNDDQDHCGIGAALDPGRCHQGDSLASSGIRSTKAQTGGRRHVHIRCEGCRIHLP